MTQAAAHIEVASARNARIDVLRGIAILLVMLLHFSLTYRLSQSPLSDWLGTRFVRALIVNGNYAVTMFFAVSGFLITSNSLHRSGTLGAIDMRQFYAYRFARIMPPLLLALCVIVTLGLAGVASFGNRVHGQDLPPSFFGIAVLSVLTFWHNLLMQSVGYFNYCLNIYWSLSIEEVFYLMFPLAAVLLRRAPIFIALCAVLVVVGPVYRSLHADNELYFMYGYGACFDAIAMGCIAALLRPRISPPLPAANAISVVAAAALVAAYLCGIDGHEAFGFSAIALATSLLLLTAPQREPSRLSAPLRWAGRHSYELYLFHIVVLALMRDIVPRDALPVVAKLPALLGFVAVSCMLAALVARYWSEPANRLLRQPWLRPRAEMAEAAS